MSNKATCPGCNSHTSAIWDLLNAPEEDKIACPYCGLPREAMIEVTAARQRTADADLLRRYEEAITRATRAEAELQKIKGAIQAVKWLLEDQDEWTVIKALWALEQTEGAEGDG